MGRVLHASKSGWFPFCLKPVDQHPVDYYRETGPGTLRPSGFSLEGVMELYWMVKSITVKGKYHQVSSSQKYGFYGKNDSSVYPFGEPTEREAESEEEIVCSSYSLFEGGGYDQYTDPGSGITYEEDVSFSILVDPFLVSDGLFWPIIALQDTAEPIGTEAGMDPGFFLATNNNPANGIPHSKIDFLGITTIQTYSLSGTAPPVPGSLSIQADAYWPYSE